MRRLATASTARLLNHTRTSSSINCTATQSYPHQQQHQLHGYSIIPAPAAAVHCVIAFTALTLEEHPAPER